MRKLKWVDFLRLSRDVRNSFIGFTVDNNNVTTCYEAGEEKKYQSALKRIKNKQEDV
jgi:hypothetical protein